jgi:hypothetical protein
MESTSLRCIVYAAGIQKREKNPKLIGAGNGSVRVPFGAIDGRGKS